MRKRLPVILMCAALTIVPSNAWAFSYALAFDMVKAYFAPHTRILKTSNPKLGLTDKIDGLPKGWVPIKITWACTTISWGGNKRKLRRVPLMSVDPKACVVHDSIDRAAGTLTCPLILTCEE